MTREEAINKVREMNLPKETKEILEALAPELAESEDERIRKEMIDFLKSEKAFQTIDLPISERWIAYLEKQKEQKSAQTEEEREYVRSLKALISDFIRDNYKTTDISFYQKIYDWLDGRHIEPEPAERSLEDDHIIGFIYDLLNEIEWKDDWAMSKDECLRLLSNYIPQKPAEWSEEDKHNLNSVINLVHAATDGAWGSCIGDRIENWLKNLPERFNLSSKQE